MKKRWLTRKNRPDTTRLRQLAMFGTAEQRSLEALAAHTDVVRLPAGRVVARAGQTARQFLVVIDGDVEETTPDGRIRPLAAGALIGAHALIDGTALPTTVTTRRETTFVVIEGSAFRWSAQEIPEVADHLAHPTNLQPKSTPRRAIPLQVRPV